MRDLLFLAILIVACASVSFAQSADYNKVEFYGGYSHNRIDTGIGDSDPALRDIIDEREGFHGFNTSVTGNITRYVGLKFDVAGHFKEKSFPFLGTARVDVESSVFNVLGGVQVKDNSTETRFKPFAQALVGVARARNKVDFTNVVWLLSFRPLAQILQKRTPALRVRLVAAWTSGPVNASTFAWSKLTTIRLASSMAHSTTFVLEQV